MGDAADDLFREAELDEMYGQDCPEHKKRFDERYGCDDCIEGLPPVNSTLRRTRGRRTTLITRSKRNRNEKQ